MINSKHNFQNYLIISYSKLILIIFLLAFVNITKAQTFDGYNYFYAPTLKYKTLEDDYFHLGFETNKYFYERGFNVVYPNTSNQITEINGKECQLLTCYITHKGGENGFNPYRVELFFKNCLGEIVYTTYATAFNAYFTPEKNLQNALKKCIRDVNQFTNYYSFNPNLTPKIQYPTVEKTNLTEEDIRKFLDNHISSEIEGIYESYSSGSKYRIGIIKMGEIYKAIILESDLNHWTKGEVKASFEESANSNIYSVKYYLGDKSLISTFGTLINNSLLSIELEKDGNKQKSEFIKLYPKNQNIKQKENDAPIIESISTGTGFAINNVGLFATNYHVIKDSKKIEILLKRNNEIKTYNAKIVGKDPSNDVAILQIIDTTFIQYKKIPYMLSENQEIGNKVFTLGFPLNDVMGQNIKVSDGIISALSGIDDDIRFYQISVPLQPGNSGGPLFNLKGELVGITTSRLNEVSVGTKTENVNYALKISLLNNLIKLTPSIKGIDINTTKTNIQYELNDLCSMYKEYICLIKCYMK